jgi:hypothetical protein
MDMKRLPVGDGHGDGQFEFRDASRGLIIRGTHPEWVLQAAAEVIGSFSRLAAESLVDELTALQSLGAATAADLAAAKAERRRRFDVKPRCSVTLGTAEYFWTTSDAPSPASAPKPLTLLPEMRVYGSPADGPQRQIAASRV